jgi:hypothetical protein
MMTPKENQNEKEILTDSTSDVNEIKDKIKDIIPKNIETKLTKEQKDKCRSIVRTINDYGVTQREKIFLCELLALELEDRELMLAFTDAVKKARAKLGESTTLEIPKKKLIL